MSLRDRTLFRGNRGASYTPERAEAALAKAVSRLRSRNPEFAQTGMTISAPSVGLHCALGADGEAENAVFHTASVGKLFTTAVIGMLLDIDDPDEAFTRFAEWIEWYDQGRTHSALGYLNPSEFRGKQAASRKKHGSSSPV